MDRKIDENEKANEKKKDEGFWDSLRDQKMEDLNDSLTELATYIERNTEATGVYIGRLEPKRKAI